MAKKNSIAQLKDIKVGKVVYLASYEGYARIRITKRECISLLGEGRWFIEGQALDDESFGGYYRKYRGSLGDKGTVDAYDNRPAQVFTNERAARFFANHFDGRNPNFAVKKENNQVAFWCKQY